MKKCSKCDVQKELSEFNNDRRNTIDGHCAECKVCMRIRTQAYYYRITTGQLSVHYKNLKNKGTESEQHAVARKKWERLEELPDGLKGCAKCNKMNYKWQRENTCPHKI